MKAPQYGTGFSYFKQKGIKQVVPEPDVLFHREYFETISGAHDHLYGVKTGKIPRKGVRDRVLLARRTYEWERLHKEGMPTSGPKPSASYEEVKSMLPWCLPQGQIEERRSPGQTWKQVGQVPSGLFMLDIDVKDNRTCPAVLRAGIDPADLSFVADQARAHAIRESIILAQTLGELPYLADLALSPSAVGFKANALVERVPADDTVYWRTLHAWISADLLEKAGVQIDPAVKSMWPCYFTYDEDALYFPGAKSIELDRASVALARENAQRRRSDSPEMGRVPVEDVKQCLLEWIKGGCLRADGSPAKGDDGLLHHDEHTKLIWGIVHAVGSDLAGELIEELGIPDHCSPSMKLRKIIDDYRQDRERSEADGGQSITWESLDHVLGVRGAAIWDWFEKHEITTEPPVCVQLHQAIREADDFDIVEEDNLGGLEESGGDGGEELERPYGMPAGRRDSERGKAICKYWATADGTRKFLKPVLNKRGELLRTHRLSLSEFVEELRITELITSREERKAITHYLIKERPVDMEIPWFHLPPGVRNVVPGNFKALNSSRVAVKFPAKLDDSTFKRLVDKYGPVKCDVDAGAGDPIALNKQRQGHLKKQGVYYRDDLFYGEPFSIIKWGEKFPRIAATLEGCFGPIEQLSPEGIDSDSEAFRVIGKEYLKHRYLERFLTFFRHWYFGALGWSPKKGPCLIIVGKTGAGKGWAFEVLLSLAMGGEMDAQTAFEGSDNTNEELTRACLWTLNDISSAGARLKTLTGSVKKFIANNSMRVRGMYKGADALKFPGARVVQSANYESLDSLPHVFSDVRDKLLVLEMVSGRDRGWHGELLPFPSESPKSLPGLGRIDAIHEELKHLLAWVLYEFRTNPVPAPNPRLSMECTRFGAGPYFSHHLQRDIQASREEQDIVPALKRMRKMVLKGALEIDGELSVDECWPSELSELMAITTLDAGKTTESTWLCLDRNAIQKYCFGYHKEIDGRKIDRALPILLRTEGTILVDPRTIKSHGRFRVRPTMEKVRKGAIRYLPQRTPYAMIQLEGPELDGAVDE